MTQPVIIQQHDCSKWFVFPLDVIPRHVFPLNHIGRIEAVLGDKARGVKPHYKLTMHCAPKTPVQCATIRACYTAAAKVLKGV